MPSFENSFISLKKYNTFGIDAKCHFFESFNSSSDLKKILSDLKESSKYLIIGKGSNLLFVNDYDGLILQSSNERIEIISENSVEAIVRAGAGLEWDKFVEWTVNKGFWGLENLSLIPGTIGASPVQNIGAYGTEVADSIESVEYYDPISESDKSIAKKDCSFGYRDSIFKRSLKSAIITSVTFKLSKLPCRKLDYKDIQQYILTNNLIEPLTIKSIRSAIIEIRNSKLPNPDEIGNGGSFFKNPIIDSDHFFELQSKYPNIPSYKISDKSIKIPAAWLIDQCGWKGYRRGDAGVHKYQALVLVNYGNASGSEILELSTEIIQSVYDNFKISLEREIIIL